MDLYSATLTLFLVKDPIGNIPIFLSLLNSVPRHRRLWIIIRENCISLLILTAFLLGGKHLLTSLHITEQSLGIAGGIILFVIAFKMAFPSESLGPKKEKGTLGEPFVVPLAIPLLAGPSAIATITLLANQYPNELAKCFLALSFVTLISTLILLFALPLQRLLGPKLLQAFERLMGIILTTIAIQLLLDSLMDYLRLHPI